MTDTGSASLETIVLEAEAAIAREEDEAASDLALSLRQGMDLRGTLRRFRSFEISTDGRSFNRVEELGEDHVTLQGPHLQIVPLNAIEGARPSPGRSASLSRQTLFSVLAGLARSRSDVVVETFTRNWSGRLVSASGDHIVIHGECEAAIPLRVIRLVGAPRRRSEPEDGSSG